MPAANLRAAFAEGTWDTPSRGGTSGSGGPVPVPPGPGVLLVSTGNTPGADAWQVATAMDVGPAGRALVAGTLNRANTTPGGINYTLPSTVGLPNGARVQTTLAVSTGTNAMTVSVNGGAGEKLMNADTGVYQATAWSTSPSGNQQGRSVVWEWNLDENAWMSV